MEQVVQLSDDEGDARGPRNLQAAHALSDEEGAIVPDHSVTAASSRNLGRKRKAADVNVYEIRVAVSKIVRKRCVCSRRICMQQFADDAEVLVKFRFELRTLDKRDSDAKVPCSEKHITLIWISII